MARNPFRTPPLAPGLGALELRFARPRDLEDPQLGSLFVLSGLVLVQTVRPADATPAPANASPLRAPEFDDVTELFIAHVADPARELRVREGERVHRGQLLARLTWKDPELERQRQHARAELAERQVVEALRGGAVHQVQALIAAQLAVPGTLARAEADLLAAREATAQARRELDRLTEETLRVSEVHAPVDGQVLTLRVHVIRGSEATTLLRLLYRKVTVPRRASRE